MAMTESRRRSKDKWARNNTKQVHLRFFLKSDAELLAWLDQQPNKTDYIRQLILRDMESRAGE